MLPDRAVGLNDALEQHFALNLRAHRLRGVLRLHFVKQASALRRHSRAIGAAAGAAAPAWAKPGALSRPDACALPGSCATACTQSERVGRRNAFNGAGLREIGRGKRLRRNRQVLNRSFRWLLFRFRRRRFLDRHRNLVRPFELGLFRRARASCFRRRRRRRPAPAHRARRFPC